MPTVLVNNYQNYSKAEMSKTNKVLKEATQCMSLEDAVLDYVRHYLVQGKTW
jgi:ADP-L-glycero-D-manno-heptose 6-epimerase